MPAESEWPEGYPRTGRGGGSRNKPCEMKDVSSRRRICLFATITTGRFHRWATMPALCRFCFRFERQGRPCARLQQESGSILSLVALQKYLWPCWLVMPLPRAYSLLQMAGVKFESSKLSHNSHNHAQEKCFIHLVVGRVAPQGV